MTTAAPLKVDTKADANSASEDQSPVKSSVLLKSQKSVVETHNSNLNQMETDFLYHLGLTKDDAESFSDVKYVVIGGLNDRMTNFAHKCGEKFGEKVDSIGIHKRYVIYRTGPILVCSHGMGGPSVSILLNELAKLLKYANADAIWMRMGTSGGIGVTPGTICI